MYSVVQRDELERFFQNNHYPSYEERETLAARLNLQEQQVQVPPNPIPRLGDHRPPALPLGRRWGGRGAREPSAARGHPDSKGSPVWTQGPAPSPPHPVWCKPANAIIPKAMPRSLPMPGPQGLSEPGVLWGRLHPGPWVSPPVATETQSQMLGLGLEGDV